MSTYRIRLIQPCDNSAIAAIIRAVSHQYGLGAAQGFAVGDAVLDDLYQYYNQTHATYWVIVNEQTGQVLGGGGIAPVLGDATLLEVQKMYFLPSIRRKGFAKQLLAQCELFARHNGFKGLYLETTALLGEAVTLYQQQGFVRLNSPRGATGHSHACELWLYKIF